MKKLIKKMFNKKKKDVFSEVPDGVCANCWGYEEYGDLVRDKFREQQVAVNHHDPTQQYSFINDFVVTHLSGIKLNTTVHGTECPTCRAVYKKK
jgi:hypothetical protein